MTEKEIARQFVRVFDNRIEVDWASIVDAALSLKVYQDSINWWSLVLQELADLGILTTNFQNSFSVILIWRDGLDLLIDLLNPNSREVSHYKGKNIFDDSYFFTREEYAVEYAQWCGYDSVVEKTYIIQNKYGIKPQLIETPPV